MNRYDSIMLKVEAVLTVSVAVVLSILLFENISLHQAAFGSPCSGDFRQFWAVGNLLSRGENPFDSSLLSSFTALHTEGRLNPVPNYSLNACTALLCYSFFSFEAARAFFLGASIVFYSYGCLRRPLEECFREGSAGSFLLPLLRFSIFSPSTRF